MRLLDPERFFDYDAFLAEEEEYQPLAAAAESLLSHAPLDATALAGLKPFMDGLDESALQDASQRKQLLAQLLDRHGTGRLLFRNTRHSIKGFPARVLHLHPCPCPANIKPPLKWRP